MNGSTFALIQLKTEYEGCDDGMSLPYQSKIILEISNEYEHLNSLKKELEYSFYKKLRRHFIPSTLQTEVISNFFEEKQKDWLYLDTRLEKITLDEYKELRKKLGVSFFKIESGRPQNHKFYPLFNKQFWDKIEDSYNRILGFNDLDNFSDNLESSNIELAYEKAVFLLLLIFNLDEFIGNPDNTNAELDYLDSFEELHSKLLAFGESYANSSLINKYGLLKFYLIGINPYLIDQEFFKYFDSKKVEILGEQKTHFDKLVNFLKTMPVKPIKIVEIW